MVKDSRLNFLIGFLGALILFVSVLTPLNVSQAHASTLPTQSSSIHLVGQVTPQDLNIYKKNDPNLFPNSIYYEQKNPWTAIAKKIAVSALRHSGYYVEKLLRPVVGKKVAKKAGKAFHAIASYIEKVEKVQEAPIALALTKAGVPPTDAATITHWIVLYFGL